MRRGFRELFAVFASAILLLNVETMRCSNVENSKKGIDVSHFQGNINWQKVKNDNVTYAMIKATEGGTYQDPKFALNWNGAKNNGIVPGAYHYFRAKSSTPQRQLQNINQTLAKVKFNKDKDALAVDVESGRNEQATPDEVADNLQKLMTGLENENYKNLYIYCDYNYWTNSVNWKKYDFSRYKLWIATWGRKEPLMPETWKNKNWSLWQHTDKGKVNGISGSVDLDFVQEFRQDPPNITKHTRFAS